MTLNEMILQCDEIATLSEKEATEWHDNQLRNLGILSSTEKLEIFPSTEIDYTYENECKDRAKYYRKIAKWLRELKFYRETFKFLRNLVSSNEYDGSDDDDTF